MVDMGLSKQSGVRILIKIKIKIKILKIKNSLKLSKQGTM